MDILIVLVPIALGLGALALGAFLWTLKHNQYEDLEGAASRILFDNDEQSGETEQDSDNK